MLSHLVAKGSGLATRFAAARATLGPVQLFGRAAGWRGYPISFRPCLFSTQKDIPREKLRNIAIIAHVDHGKTTLVDRLLQAGGYVHKDGEDRTMDTKDLESERGITIMSKNTTVEWNGYRFNIVDTPGHQDFGGEVERVLSMVDGALVLVDASEGVMSQTKFVMGLALDMGLKMMIVLNKADRPTARLADGDVENEIFDLLLSLDASDEQMEYQTFFASAKYGWTVDDASDIPDEDVDISETNLGMDILLQAVVDDFDPPCGEDAKQNAFALAVNNISYDNYLGRLITGRVEAGAITSGSKLKVLRADEVGEGEEAATEAVTSIFRTRGVERYKVDSAVAGDIVTIAGIASAGVSDTVCEASVVEPLPTIALTPPTVAMTFGPNTGPLKGKCPATEYVTGGQIKSRLEKEVQNNVTLELYPVAGSAESMEVRGKGELQIGILIEEMRREGYEFLVSPPTILQRKNKETGVMEEPVEEVLVDVGIDYQGAVMEKISAIQGTVNEIRDMAGSDRIRITFDSTSRSLLGFRHELRLETHADAVVCSNLSHYAPAKKFTVAGSMVKGRLVSTDNGKSNAYALKSLEARGKLFISGGVQVYEGMVFGESNTGRELCANPTKAKKLTNIRSAGADESLRLRPPRRLSLEDYLSYMNEDEIIEVTPEAVRLRKFELSKAERAKIKKKTKINE